MKTKLKTILFLVPVLLAGCASNPALTQTAIRLTVSTGVAVGSQQSPQVVPYLRAAGSVVCATAAGTDVSPAAVVAALNGTPDVDALKTTEGLLILNGALGIYQLAWDQLGSNTNNLATLKGDLQAVCDGITLGLPGQATALKMQMAPRVK